MEILLEWTNVIGDVKKSIKKDKFYINLIFYEKFVRNNKCRMLGYDPCVSVTNNVFLSKSKEKRIKLK